MQAFILLVCVLCGATSGVVYDILFIARTIVCGVNKQAYTIKDKIFIFVCDLIYLSAFAVAFIYVCICFDIYTFRLYMLIGAALGALIYLKSFHLCIDFLIKRVYNSISKSIRSRKSNYEGRKARQNSGSNNR